MAYIPGNNINNVIFGSSEDDIIYGMGGDDTLYGGYGEDTLWGGEGSDELHGGWGDDVFFTAGGGRDYYYGNTGDDTFFAGFEGDGTNIFNGGIGVDTVDYSWSYRAVYLSLQSSELFGSGSDRYTDIENARGSYYDDIIFGSIKNNVLEGQGGDDILSGRSGNDTLIGGSGNDTLEGGAGYDILTGGTGADTFVFSGHDTYSGGKKWGGITDFNANADDKIDISGTLDELDLTFIGRTGFSGTGNGEVRIESDFFADPLRATVHVDLDGDGTSDGLIFIQLASIFGEPGADDFIL